LSDGISLSDHRYIVFMLGEPLDGHTGSARYPRWNTKMLDRNLFKETVDWLCGDGCPAESRSSHRTLRELSLLHMMSPLKDLNTMTPEEEFIGGLKRYLKLENAARRLLTRARRRGDLCADLEKLYKKARVVLCKKINKAKSESWDLLIGTIDDDSWELSYKLVMDRLQHSGSALTETLECYRRKAT